MINDTKCGFWFFDGSGLVTPVGGKFNLDTGSTHFTEGVQKTNLDGTNSNHLIYL